MIRFKTMSYAILAFALPVSAQASTAGNVKGKLSPYVLSQVENKATKRFSILVSLKEQANLGATAKIQGKAAKGQAVYQQLVATAQQTQAPLLAWSKSKNLRTQSFYLKNMVAIFDVTPAQALQIAKRDDVARLIGNAVVHSLPKVVRDAAPLAAAEDDGNGPGANLTSIGADRVWAEFGANGQGIVIAGQDTGVEWKHPALKAKYRGWKDGQADHTYSWHDAIHEAIAAGSNPCGLNAAEPCDDNDHGTHTIGTVVGDDGAGNQVGVAPGAQWIACRNMDQGEGRPSTYIECFEFFLAPYPQNGNAATDGKPELAPHVINNSWGCPPSEGCEAAEILPVLESLKAAGIMVVASAGNEGPGCSTIADPPAMHSAATLSVGAHSHTNGNIASFSSRGPSKFDGEVGPDVTAPGVGIRSAVRGGGFSGLMWSGTSMAGPHVVGQVALLWSADPTLVGQIDQTVAVIRSTATAKETSESCGDVAGSTIPNNTFGYGLIDARKAVASRVQPN